MKREWKGRKREGKKESKGRGREGGGEREKWVRCIVVNLPKPKVGKKNCVKSRDVSI